MDDSRQVTAADSRRGAATAPRDTWSPAPGLIPAFPHTTLPAPAPQQRPAAQRGAAAFAAHRHDATRLAREPQTYAELAEADYLSAVGELRGLAAVESALAALKARVIERIDSSARRLGHLAELDPWQAELLGIATAAEVSAALDLPPRSGRQLLSECTELVRHHPACLSALESHRLSWRNALVLLENYDSIADLHDDSGSTLASEQQLAAFEQQLLTVAPGMTTAKFSRQARRLRERCHPASITARHLKARADRKMVLLPDRDGMSWLSLFLPADTAQGLWNAATRSARALQGPQEPRTLSQLRVDVLAERGLHGGAASSPGRDAAPGRASRRRPRPHAQVLVTVPLLSLLGRGDEVAELEGYGPIPPLMARELAADSPTLYRIMVDPFTNAFLAMDPTRYRVTGAIRNLLRARDGTCVFPGCQTVTDDTELDHLLAWQAGGGSSPSNLAHECGVHHRLKHFQDGKRRDGTPGDAAQHSQDAVRANSRVLQGWQVAADHPVADRPGWTSPAGQHYAPEPQLTTPCHVPPQILAHLARGDTPH